MTRPDTVLNILQFFAVNDELPTDISEDLNRTAQLYARTDTRSPEKLVALRKLLEARDAMVRSFSDKSNR